jgi:hypothetical protein
LHLHFNPAFKIRHGHARRLLCKKRQFLHPLIRRCERQENRNLHRLAAIKPEATA